MANPFFNASENRLRAGLRIVLFFFLAIFLMTPAAFFRNNYITALLAGVAVFLAAWFAGKILDNRRLSGFGLGGGRLWVKEFFIGAGMGLAAQTVIFLAEWQGGWLEITGLGGRSSNGTLWMVSTGAVLVQMLFVGFYEELMFRGYFLRNLAEGLTIGSITPRAAAIISVAVTSILFGAAHITNPGASFISTFNIVLAGFMLAFPFVMTGRLALSVGAHFAWNFVMGGIYGLPVSGMAPGHSLIQVADTGPEFITGGSFGPEAGLTGILGMLIIVALVYGYQKKTAGKAALHPSFKEEYERPDIMIFEK